MIYDRNGVPITEGAVLYNMSRFTFKCALVVVTCVDFGDGRDRVDGIVLEWRWGMHVGEDRCWGVLRHGVLCEYEIVGWHHR